MGEGKKRALCVTFDRQVKLEFHGTTVTSDAGLIAYRERAIPNPTPNRTADFGLSVLSVDGPPLP